ncbi:MAG: hypothetical protein JWN71_1678 [Xanthobacteraceae bacterium]|jgi:hypothetical protein|nr:hypothetical protein [Xanthobacteraceae bacterium]
MRLRNFAVAIGCAALVSGMVPAGAQEAKPHTYLLKAGVTPARYDADTAACIAEVKKTYFDPAVANINTPYQPGLAGAAVSGFARGWERGKIKREALTRFSTCMMKTKGYRVAKLTPKQTETYNRLRYDQHSAAEKILAGGGNIASLLSN